MSRQFRLTNRNEDGSPTRDRDARVLRYVSGPNSSSSPVAFNNRAGSAGTTNQTVPDNIMPNNPVGPRRNSNIITSPATSDHHYYPSPMTLQTTININNYNGNQTFPSSNSSLPRLFGSSLILVPTSFGQLGPAPSNYHHNQNYGGNNNAAAAAFTPTGTSNASVKRSRSPNFERGESSNPQSGGISRRRTDPPASTFQQDYVNHDIMSSISSPLSAGYNNTANALYAGMLLPHVNQSGVAAQNSITRQSPIICRHPLHVSPAGFFDYAPSYDSPSQSFIDEDYVRFLFATRQEIPQARFTMTRRTQPASASTSTRSLYPSAMTRGTTHAAATTSPFQRNNNLLSSGAGSSFPSRSPGLGFNGFNNHRNNNNTNTNWQLFDSNRQRIDETFVRSTIGVQRYVRILPNGSVDQYLATSIVPARPNSSAPRRPQPPFGPSTSSYRLNPPPPTPEYGFSTAAEYDQYMQNGTTLARSGNHLRGNNRILTSTSPELRAARNRLRDEVFNSIQHLRSGGSVEMEELRNTANSIVLNVLGSQERIDMLYSNDEWPYEAILALEEHNGRVEIGLSEEEILTYIETEFHVSNPLETNTQNQTCTICQEDYVEGEVIGRLDCRHIYHLECIKQWLLLKNICPICKQPALEIDEDESD